MFGKKLFVQDHLPRKVKIVIKVQLKIFTDKAIYQKICLWLKVLQIHKQV